MKLEARLGGRRRLYWGGVALVVVAVTVLWMTLRPSTRAPSATLAIPVVATPATVDNMPVVYSALGTVTPLASVTVRTQINGQLVAVGFTEGQEVQVGQFLAQIDPRPYQAALDQAEGQLARDQAQLAGASVNLARYALLMKQDSIAKQTYDDQTATVHQLEGTVKLDQAAVETARVNLSYCRIVAPVAGRVGLRQVDPGNYVTPSDTNGIVLLNQMRPISVLFSLPEDDLEAVLRGSRGGSKLPVVAYGRTGTVKLAAGTLDSIDNTISTSTGTFELRAAFANTDETLYPNQFVNIQITVDVLKSVIVIPTAGIQRGAPGTSVYVVNKDDTVSVRPVTLGPSTAESVAVGEGLQAGESVVVDGAAVLNAFQGVEDNLAALRVLQEQAAVQDAAVAAASDAERLIVNQYRAGTVDYTSVVTAETTALGDRQTALNVLQSRLNASVLLVENLGGGWNSAELPDASLPVPPPGFAPAAETKESR